MDCVVGYMVLLLLWKKIVCGLLVGCVQFVVVCLVVECECEIKVFVLEEFWEIDVNMMMLFGEVLLLQVMYQNDKLFWLVNCEQMFVVVSLLEKVCYSVLECEDKLISSKSGVLFIIFML